MPRLDEIVHAIDRFAPWRTALPDDRVGLQIEASDRPCDRGLVTLDPSLAAFERARELGAQVVVGHHPVIWNPLKSVCVSHPAERAVAYLLQHGISFIAAHTNWDVAKGGINDALLAQLGMVADGSFGPSGSLSRLKLVTFCPTADVESLVDALSEAGAGVIGDYSRCAFVSEGQGTFRAGVGASPTVGRVGEITHVAETRVEMVLPVEARAQVVAALRATHPYEEPAYDVLPLEAEPEARIGRIGRLRTPMTLAELASLVQESLSTRPLAWGDPNGVVETVAALGGSGGDRWAAAKTSGADALVTGEATQDQALAATESGLGVVVAGHYATEQPGVAVLAARLRQEVTDIAWEINEPRPGHAGRPF